jgi:hypothetical protein
MWPLAIGIFGVLATLAAGQLPRLYRRIQLWRRVPTYFIIPDKRHHDCDFAVQTEAEHRTREIVVGLGKPIIIDLVIEPRVDITSNQILAEFDGDLNEKPTITELYNRFIEVGPRRRIVPGQIGNEDYIDKHKGYHIVETMNWSSGMTKTLGFKILPRHTGTFHFKMTALGDLIEVTTKRLSLVVQEHPVRYIRCCSREHRRNECTTIGIRPKVKVAPMGGNRTPCERPERERREGDKADAEIA